MKFERCSSKKLNEENDKIYDDGRRAAERIVKKALSQRVIDRINSEAKKIILYSLMNAIEEEGIVGNRQLYGNELLNTDTIAVNITPEFKKDLRAAVRKEAVNIKRENAARKCVVFDCSEDVSTKMVASEVRKYVGTSCDRFFAYDDGVTDTFNGTHGESPVNTFLAWRDENTDKYGNVLYVTSRKGFKDLSENEQARATFYELTEALNNESCATNESCSEKKSGKKLTESKYSDKIRIYYGPVTRIGESEQYEIPYEEYRISTGDLVNKGTEDFSIERAQQGIKKYVFRAKSPDGGAPLEIGPLYISRDIDEGIIEDAIKNIYDMDAVRMWESDIIIHPMEIDAEEYSR